MNKHMHKRPLVTFAVFAYNQEKYIQEAIEGAFAQTYRPLEIILSDDHSSDRTYEIMREMKKAYQGPHRIKVYQNRLNLGLAGNIDSAVDKASGNIIVIAAGDDISLRDRTQILVNKFQGDEETMAVFSDFDPIGGSCDEEKQKFIPEITLFDMIVDGGGVQKGATYAYRRECFYWPSRLPSWLISEDRMLPFRAALLGKVRYVDYRLVQYRRSSSEQAGIENKNRLLGYDHPLHLQCLQKHICSWRENTQAPKIHAFILRQLLNWAAKARFMKKQSGLRRYSGMALMLPLRVLRKMYFEYRRLGHMTSDE